MMRLADPVYRVKFKEIVNNSESNIKNFNEATVDIIVGCGEYSFMHAVRYVYNKYDFIEIISIEKVANIHFDIREDKK
jgi:hypothetical protein